VPPPRSGVFISYARSDGAAIARDLQQRLQAEGIPLWRDLDCLEGGRDWWLQITAALDDVEFMVLVMTPAAMESAIVRKEWRYARQRGVCVYPVKGVAGLDFESLPRWMRTVHFYDLDREWTKFLNDLQTRCVRPRVPFMAEDLPSEFVARPAEYERLLFHLLDRECDEPLATTVAIRAAGGYGKTVLARALCHDEAIQNAFDDGVLWVTLGENPGELTGRVEDLIYILSGQRPAFAGLEAATALLVELLADRDVLIVIDDVWDNAHLKPFLQGGPHCARVITSRIVDALPAGAHRVDVDAMTPSEALALLGYALPSGFSKELGALAERLGEWPMLLKLVNSTLRDRLQAGQAFADVLAYVNKALTRRGLTFFDARDASARHQAVGRTIELSTERLNEHERDRFTELAVFPEDVTIPLATLEKFWGRTGGLDDVDTENLADRMSRLSLLLAFDPTLRYVRMHDIIRKFLIHQLGDRLALRHAELLEAHRPGSGTWADLAAKEPYLWDHLADHLLAAGKGSELLSTVTDGRYLAAKTFARNALAVESDLRAAEREAPLEPGIRALSRRFVQSSHLLNRGGSATEVGVTLLSRIQHVPELAVVAATIARALPGPYLRAAHPLPDLPHPALIRTLSAGTSTMWGCAVSPDGAFVVAAGYDGTLIVWDTATAAERRRLTGHTSWVRRCAVSADGTFIVSASFDRRLRVWDAATGEVRQILLGHTDGVTDCAITPDSRFVVSSSLDETIRIWDVATGALVRTLSAQWKDERGGWLVQSTPSGHLASIWSCAVSADGRFILSASADHTVKLWNFDTGEELRTLTGHTAAVQGCAFSPDGGLVASAGADGTLRIWDTQSGAVRLKLDPQVGALNACAFTPDGASIAFACEDATVRVRDAATGDERSTYSGHTDIVNDCAVAADGSFLVSASMDGSLKLWDARQDSGTAQSPGHRGGLNSCAIADDDTLIAGGADMLLTVVRARSGAVRGSFFGHTGPVRGCAVLPGRRGLIAGSEDKSLRVWHIVTGEPLATLRGHRDWVNACDVSADGSLIVSGSADKTLRVWDALTWARRLTIVAHEDAVNACRCSPDGAFVLSASTDCTMKIWPMASLRDAWESPFMGEHRMTMAGWERLLVPRVLHGHSGAVNDCAIAPDSSFVVSASSDRSIRVWDCNTLELRRTMTGHRRDVNGCAISPDGRWIASVGNDSTIRIWSSATGECVTTLTVDGVLAQCTWFGDGRRLAAVGAGGLYMVELSGD
jgi:WD40 repeat protein